MARKSSLNTILSAAVKAEKLREKQQREQQKLHLARLKAAENEQKEREKARQAEAKGRAAFYTYTRMNEVEAKNEDLDSKVNALENFLQNHLGNRKPFQFASLKRKLVLPLFQLGAIAQPLPSPLSIDSYMPAKPPSWQLIIPSNKKKYDEQVENAKRLHEADIAKWKRQENERLEKIERLKRDHSAKVAEITEATNIHNAAIDEIQSQLENGNPDAITEYFKLVLEALDVPDMFPHEFKFAYVPESKQLVIEYDLPTFDVVPEVASFKYAKTKDEITETARPLTQRKSIYGGAVAQTTLVVLHELFTAYKSPFLETIVFNGYVDSIDKGTGKAIRPCLITVRTTRDIFDDLDLTRVDPAACLKTLSASVSKSPTELAPVRPVLELNMVDSRFIEEADVLSVLDQRQNLMELSPSEFESLITNLFTKMGLEARQTQASRDGGVDCVAFDNRPIFGGKVVIQAKRYKNTVGVSAVRDLFGTLQNEGASKGILVTTSGYGKAAYEFANGKPIELLDVTHLLHLLAEHAGIEAKIAIPDEWRDPILDKPFSE